MEKTQPESRDVAVSVPVASEIVKSKDSSAGMDEAASRRAFNEYTAQVREELVNSAEHRAAAVIKNR